MGDVTKRAYVPEGKTLQDFLNSKARVQGIMGPIGGGKTSCVLMKHVFVAQHQMVSPRDGKRHYRVAVVRDTYRQLWATLIRTWWDWVPKPSGTWTGPNDGPARHDIRLRLADQTTLDFTIYFVAIGENRIEDVLRGFEVTAFHLNEADLLAPEVLTFCRGRAGRYPKTADGGPTWRGVTMDYNAPDEENYLAKLMEDPPDGFEFFVQPGGREPDAENLSYLPAGYYEDQIAGAPEWYVRRMVDNRIGYSRDGKPIFPEFNERIHCANNDMVPTPERPLVIGGDAGRTPALIVLQPQVDGRWWVLDEFCGRDMGAKSFGTAAAIFLRERYPGFKITAWGDPASSFAGDQDEQSYLEILSVAMGLAWRAAPGGNALTPRLEVVRSVLNRMIDGQPGFLLSRRCRMLRKAFASGYRYKRLRIVNSERYDDKPDKNEFSHPMDGLQNALLGGGEYYEVTERKKASAARHKQTQALDDGEEWRPGRQAAAYDE